MPRRIEIEVHKTEYDAEESLNERKGDGFSITIEKYRDASWSNQTTAAINNTASNKDSSDVWVLIATK